jgi:hypothetical protein
MGRPRSSFWAGTPAWRRRIIVASRMNPFGRYGRGLRGNAMDDIIKRLDEQDRKLDAIYASVERTRKYLRWTLIRQLIFVTSLCGRVVE